MIAVTSPATSFLPPLPVVIPLLGAALLAAFRRWLGRTVADVLAILVAGATVAASGILLHRVLAGPVVYWFGNWYPRGSMVLGIAFLAEPVGAGLALLAAVLTFLALLSAWRSLDSGGDHLQPLMLIFLAAMSGFVLTADLFNLFVFFELMSTAAFALCGLKTAEPAPLQGSFNFAVTNTVAAFMVLTGIAMLYAMTGALNMAQVGLLIAQRHDPPVIFALTLLTCGFLVKAAAVPFQLWLPDAHAVAPTPVCVLFSGLMVELGLYAVMRLHIVVFQGALSAHVVQMRALLLVFAAATVVVGGVMCYMEHHLKRVLAFSTISHTGLMLLCFALGGPLALSAALIYLLAHAFIKGSLFFSTGLLLRRLRGIGERALFGKGRGLPVVAVLWFAGGVGLAAAPGFASSLGAAAAERAARQAGVPAWGVSGLFLLSGILTAAAVFRVGLHTFAGWGSEPVTDQAAEVGELPEGEDAQRKLRWNHLAPPAVCLTAAILLAIVPGWLGPLAKAAVQMSSQPAYLHTLYHGSSPVLESAAASPLRLGAAAWHGVLACVLAMLLACSSVFRSRLPRFARLGAFLEGGSKALRTWQSGHPGDYVFWVISGTVLFGLLAQVLLRS